MYPTLSSETKYNIVNKRHRLGRNLRVGDLIIIKHPNMIAHAGKRVIGLQGDFVVRDPNLSPTVGGMPIAGGGGGGAAAGAYDAASEANRHEPEMIEVPPGHIWVAGDNLSWSRDSRFYGPVPMGLILGKIVRHSNPKSDWLVDMVRTGGDQLRPARGSQEGADDWSLAFRSYLGMETQGNIEEYDLQKEEKS